MPLDYAFCRAAAWLDGLETAADRLPPTLARQLADMQLDERLARIAVAAFLYPVDVVTPDISSSDEIRVFLQPVTSMQEDLRDILRDRQKLVLEMAVIAETLELTQKFRALWPKNLASAAPRMMELEGMAASLDALWHIGQQTYFSFPRTAITGKNESQVSASVLLALLLTEERLRAGLWQGSLNMANRAWTMLAEKNAAEIFPSEIAAWLGAGILDARAKAQWELGQLGLAETDYDAALTLLDRVPQKRHFCSGLYARRGELRRIKNNIPGMCADFLDACAGGECQPLAAARRRGECIGGKE